MTDLPSTSLSTSSRTSPPNVAQLQALTQQARDIILSRQDPNTGLLPASTAITVHGDYTHAWVRDNVYSILAVWALSRAWQAHDPAQADALGDSVVRLMRGLLAAMMRQAPKIERFKHTQHPHDALHAKYSTQTGEPVVGDDQWGHLQIDATAIFLLMLGQMSAGGLRIVQTRDELRLVQNLVWYLAPAWRTPDYGIWERGHKQNDGQAELNASSVGMAKAALEVINGAQLLAEPGSPRIHVPADAIAQARHTLEGMLPRESVSKEIDAALLSVIGFPAFAIGNTALVERTRQAIVTQLQGRYGCKRFLRDGHQTAVEDHSRLHYEPGELSRFEHIESEWPLFFCYLLLDAVMRGDTAAAADWRARLEGLTVERDGQRLLPELYSVPLAAVAAEQAEPHSQERVPNDNVPLVWAQSLYLVGVLLQEGWVSPRALLPRGRAAQDTAPETLREQVCVQVALLGTDRLVQARLASHGLACETLDEVAPLVEVRDADDLARAFAVLGEAPLLGLSGRPVGERLGALTTGQVFTLAPGAEAAEVAGTAGASAPRRVIFRPALQRRQGFYLHLDNRLLVDELRAEVAYLRRYWQVRDQEGQPLLALVISESMLDAHGADRLVAYLRELLSPEGGAGVPAGVQSGPLASLLPQVRTVAMDWLDLPSAQALWSAGAVTGDDAVAPVTTGEVAAPRSRWAEASTRPLAPSRAAALEHESDPQVLVQRWRASRNPYEHVEILGLLVQRHHAADWVLDGHSVWQWTQQLYAKACQTRQWGLIRRAAGVLGLQDDGLEDAVAQIVARQKRIVVGRSYGDGALIARPLGSAEIAERIHRFGGDDPRARVLLQEVVSLLGTLIKAEPALFSGTLTLRAWYLVLLLTGWLAREHELTQAEAFDFLLSLSPQAILGRLREVIAHEQAMSRNLREVQALHVALGHGASSRSPAGLVTVNFSAEMDPVLDPGLGSWSAWREMQGVITRMPEDFYVRVWEVLRHVPGLVIGDQLDSRNRLDSHRLRADMTPSERGFALQVEDLLNKIHAPEYRQLTIEALLAVADICRANPTLCTDGLLVMDVLIGVAVRRGWESGLAEGQVLDYNEHKAQAWQDFYASPPHRVAQCVMGALQELLAPVPMPLEDTAPVSEQVLTELSGSA